MLTYQILKIHHELPLLCAHNPALESQLKFIFDFVCPIYLFIQVQFTPYWSDFYFFINKRFFLFTLLVHIASLDVND